MAKQKDKVETFLIENIKTKEATVKQYYNWYTNSVKVLEEAKDLLNTYKKKGE